jgi:hypothetical protein
MNAAMQAITSKRTWREIAEGGAFISWKNSKGAELG